jgi:outer membrane protein assembly factor BamB
MSQVGGDILERNFPTPPDAFDRLVRRRRRKSRRRKAAAVVTAALVGGAVIVAAVIGLRARSNRHEPARGPITPTSVSNLGLRWFGRLDASVDAPPTVSGDRVYVIRHGAIEAFPAECSAPECPPVWQAPLLGTGVDLWWAPPLVSGGLVYAGARDGMYAFPTVCDGRSPCAPAWIGRTTGSDTSGAPAIAGETVFVGSADGFMYAFPLSCPDSSSGCPAEWKGALPGGFTGGAPVVSGGVVYIGSANGTMEAFSTSCVPSAGICAPLWKTKVPGPKADQMFGATLTPLIYRDGAVYMAAGTSLYAFPADCAHPPVCPPAWAGRGSSPVTGFTLSGGLIYASVFDGSTDVYDLSCRARICQPAWGIQGYGLTAIAGDLVFTQGPGKMAVFSAGCGLSGQCESLWEKGPTSINALGTVADDTLYATDSTGFVFAFAIGGRVALPHIGPSVLVIRQSPWYLVFYAVVLGVAVAWFVRARRLRDRLEWAGPFGPEDPD